MAEPVKLRSPFNGGIIEVPPSMPPSQLAALEMRGFVRIEPAPSRDESRRARNANQKKDE